MTRKTRLLFVIENSAYGGGEKVFSTLIRGLPAGDFEIFCAALPRGRFYEENKARCLFLPLDLTSRVSPRAIGRLAALMREYKIDLAHSQGSRADFYCALAAARAGVPAVATVAMPVDGFDVGFLRKKVYSLFYSFAERRLAGVITVSESLRRTLVAGHGVAEEKLFLVPNPVDAAEFNPESFDAAPMVEKYSLRGRFVLGALGRLEWQKGYPVLLEALARLLAVEPELRKKLVCLIGGSGSMEAELKLAARKAGLSGNVIFCGEVASPKDFLSAVDIFVMPSLLEGQPLALLEAMAMAKPVIASDIPGISDSAESGKEALLVPPGEPEAFVSAVRSLLASPELGRELGRNGRARASGYKPEDFLKAHADIYRRLAGRAGD